MSYYLEFYAYMFVSEIHPPFFSGYDSFILLRKGV